MNAFLKILLKERLDSLFGFELDEINESKKNIKDNELSLFKMGGTTVLKILYKLGKNRAT